jgi:hypothetical protein
MGRQKRRAGCGVKVAGALSRADFIDYSAFAGFEPEWNRCGAYKGKLTTFSKKPKPAGLFLACPTNPEVSMKPVRYPSLYQINTRVWLTELSHSLRRRATLDDIPDAELDALAKKGFDWVWLLSVWQTGPAAQQVSRSNPEWRREFHETLPDLRDEDIPGSGFAITGYTAHTDLGGDAALARLRERLKKRGFKLMLDLVPNHMGLGHPWIEDHPEHFIRGNEGRRRK